MGLLKSLTEYEPYTWETGDVITAELLNHMEQGIAAASQGGGSGDEGNEFFVRVITGDNVEVDKTFSEIYEAFQDGKKIIPVFNTGQGAAFFVGNSVISSSLITFNFINISGDSDSITVNKPVLYIQSNGDTTYTVNGWTADATET